MADLPVGVSRNPQLNQLVRGYRAEDGTRYALISNQSMIGGNQDQKFQLAVIRPEQNPVFYNARLTAPAHARSHPHGLEVSGLNGKLTIGGNNFERTLTAPALGGSINMGTEIGIDQLKELNLSSRQTALRPPGMG